MKLLYFILYGVLWLFSLLPLSVHYLLSDVIFLIIYRLVGYRRKMVRRHLEECFPENTAVERLQVERDFYHWFCDYFVETVKLLTISRKNLKHRMLFKGTELVDEILSEGQSIGIYLGHYCNWEWITSLPLWITHKVQCAQIYHPIENKGIDQLFLRLRQRHGSVCIPMAETPRRIMQYRLQGQQVVIGYISDQVPFWNNIHHWCQFLNHDTPVLTGTERLVQKTGHAVLYLDVKRLQRGYYEAEFKLITREPQKMCNYKITDIYFRLLEESIRRNPACYLWTHNRWKRTREEYNLRYNEATGRVDIISTVEELKEKANDICKG